MKESPSQFLETANQLFGIETFHNLTSVSGERVSPQAVSEKVFLPYKAGVIGASWNTIGSRLQAGRKVVSNI